MTGDRGDADGAPSGGAAAGARVLAGAVVLAALLLAVGQIVSQLIAALSGTGLMGLLLRALFAKGRKD